MIRRKFIATGALPLAALAQSRRSAQGPGGAASPGPVEPGSVSGTSFPSRQRLPLNGEWEYEPLCWTWLQEDDTFREDRAAVPPAGRMPVPSNWHLAGLPDFHGRVAFRRSFTSGPEWTGHPVWLCFRGIDYYARIRLNGHALGTHEGYFEPFEIEVTGLLQPGANLLEVIVDAPREEPGKLWYNQKRQIKGILNAWLPKERQMETTGGIIGAVYLERRGGVQIRAARFTTKLAPANLNTTAGNPPAWRARVLVDVEFFSRAPGAVDLEVSIGQDRWRGEVRAQPGANRQSVVIEIEKPRLWYTCDFGKPYLYTAAVSVTRGAENDRCECPVGLREIQFDPAKGEWRLNGERFFVRGTNVIPDKWLAHFDGDRIARDIGLLRRAHVNGVRVCVHVTRDEFYAACDRAGILVWQDFPLQWRYAMDARFVAEACRQMRAMIRHLYNHPSISVWTCQNEPSLPNRLQLDPALAAAARAEEPARDVSEACANAEHPYYGWYYGELRDYELIPGAPVVSEFGAQALPSPAEMRQLLGAGAWPPGARWEDKGFEVFSTLYVAKIPPGKSLEEFVANSQAYQARLIQFSIEQYRLAKYDKLGGFFHFMFADGWPTIGWTVLSYERVPKAGYAAFQRALQPVLAIAELPSTRLQTRPDEMALYCAGWVVNDTREELKRCRVVFELRGSRGNIILRELTTDIPADSVHPLAPNPSRRGPMVSLNLPPGTVLAEGDYKFVVSVHSASGALLSENLYDVTVVDFVKLAEAR